MTAVPLFSTMKEHVSFRVLGQQWISMAQRNKIRQALSTQAELVRISWWLFEGSSWYLFTLSLVLEVQYLYLYFELKGK